MLGQRPSIFAGGSQPAQHFFRIGGVLTKRTRHENCGNPGLLSRATLQPMPTMVKFPRHGQFYVLFACGSGQRAQESLMYGHGIFTSELAKFINSQSKFNMTSETVACVTEAVSKRTCNLQRPELLSRSSKRWSAQVWNVPHCNKRFVGRSVLIDQLASRLTEPGLLCLVATSGLAGVGKSQLLIEFLNSRCQNKRKRLVAQCRVRACSGARLG